MPGSICLFHPFSIQGGEEETLEFEKDELYRFGQKHICFTHHIILFSPWSFAVSHVFTSLVSANLWAQGRTKECQGAPVSYLRLPQPQAENFKWPLQSSWKRTVDMLFHLYTVRMPIPQKQCSNPLTWWVSGNSWQQPQAKPVISLRDVSFGSAYDGFHRSSVNHTRRSKSL